MYNIILNFVKQIIKKKESERAIFINLVNNIIKIVLIFKYFTYTQFYMYMMIIFFKTFI